MPASAYSRELLRSRMSDAVDRLLAALDALDGDTDLEPEVDHEHDGREPEEGL